MKNLFCTFALLTLCTYFTLGQSQNDSIFIEKVFDGQRYYHGENLISMKELVNILKVNEHAYKEIRSARTSQTIAMILSFTGGFMIGWPIGTSLAGGDPQWEIAAIGLGVVIVSIPINISHRKKAARAIDIYNSGLQISSEQNKGDLRMSLSTGSIGINFRF